MEKKNDVLAMTKQEFDKWLTSAEEQDVAQAFDVILLNIRSRGYGNMPWESKRRIILCYRKARKFYGPAKIASMVFSCLPSAILLFSQCFIVMEKILGIGMFGNIPWSLAVAPIVLWMLFDWIFDIFNFRSK